MKIAFKSSQVWIGVREGFYGAPLTQPARFLSAQVSSSLMSVNETAAL